MNRRLIDLGLRLVAQAAALLVPLVFYLGANEVFHLPKGIALVVTGSVAAVLLLLRGEPLRTRALLPAALFLGSCALSLLATPLTDATVERIWELSAVVILMLVAESGVVSPTKLLGLMLTAHFLVTLYAAAQYLGLDTIQWSSFGERAVYSTAGNPDFLAAQTSLVLPIMVGIIVIRPPMGLSWVMGGCLVLAFPSLFYTRARGANISFFVSALAMAWMVNRYVFNIGVRRFLAWAGAAAVAVALFLAVLPTGRHFLSKFGELADPLKSSSVQIRLFYWHSGFLMAQEHPLTGAGAGAFHLAGTRTQGMAQAIWDRRWPRAAQVVSPHLELYAHNDYVQIFSENGPLGLGFFVWSGIALIALGLGALARLGPAMRTERWMLIGLIAAVVSFYANAMTNFPMRVATNFHSFYAIMVPALLALTAMRPFSIPLPRWRALAAIAAVGAFLLSARVVGKLVGSQYLKQGNLAMNAGYAAIAVPSLDKAGLMRPYHTDAILVHYYKGVALRNAGRYREAAEAFSRSIDVFRYFPEGFRERGIALSGVATVLMKRDRGESARMMELAASDLRTATGLNPKDEISQFHLGRVLYSLGRCPEAVPALRAAVKLSGDRIPDARYELALCLMETGHAGEAVTELELLLGANPNQPTVKAMLAKALKLAAREKRAR